MCDGVTVCIVLLCVCVCVKVIILLLCLWGCFGGVCRSFCHVISANSNDNTTLTTIITTADYYTQIMSTLNMEKQYIVE